MQQPIMDWKNLRQKKGQSVQEYTQEFRKKALALGIPLYTGNFTQVHRRITFILTTYNFDV